MSEDEKQRNMTSDVPVAHTTTNIYEKGNWIVDTCATNHITHKTLVLENQTSGIHEPHVIIPNSERIDIEGKGDHTFDSEIKIKGVLHVPKFNCNLLSVSKLSRDLHCVVHFSIFLYYVGIKFEDIN